MLKVNVRPIRKPSQDELTASQTKFAAGARRVNLSPLAGVRKGALPSFILPPLFQQWRWVGVVAST
jgi:hypothetical protein